MKKIRGEHRTKATCREANSSLHVEVGAGKLADALRPDTEGDASYQALESALYRLRQLLGSPGVVTMAGGKLRFLRAIARSRTVMRSAVEFQNAGPLPKCQARSYGKGRQLCQPGDDGTRL
jgi:hypothetical protein